MSLNLQTPDLKTYGYLEAPWTLGYQTLRVPVHQIGEEPTIGTALLRSCKLSVDFVPDGDVQVHPIV